jgi:hypothetical protein
VTDAGWKPCGTGPPTSATGVVLELSVGPEVLELSEPVDEPDSDDPHASVSVSTAAVATIVNRLHRVPRPPSPWRKGTRARPTTARAGSANGVGHRQVTTDRLRAKSPAGSVIHRTTRIPAAASSSTTPS